MPQYSSETCKVVKCRSAVAVGKKYCLAHQSFVARAKPRFEALIVAILVSPITAILKWLKGFSIRETLRRQSVSLAPSSGAQPLSKTQTASPTPREMQKTDGCISSVVVEETVVEETVIVAATRVRRRFRIGFKKNG